jgi:hypothetical protein
LEMECSHWVIRKFSGCQQWRTVWNVNKIRGWKKTRNMLKWIACEKLKYTTQSVLLTKNIFILIIWYMPFVFIHLINDQLYNTDKCFNHYNVFTGLT